MADMTMTWELAGTGWVRVHVSDEGNEAKAIASYLTEAPEDMLNAVASLRSGDATAQVFFEAEPNA